MIRSVAPWLHRALGRPQALEDWTASDLSGALRSIGLAPVKVFGKPRAGAGTAGTGVCLKTGYLPVQVAPSNRVSSYDVLLFIFPSLKGDGS